MAARRSWIAVTLTVLALVALACTLVLGAGAAFVWRHIDRETVGAERAGDEFTRLRARFVREQPMIEVTADNDVMVHPNPAAGGDIGVVHLVAYNPQTQRLVRVSMPMWLLRLAPTRNFSLTDQSDFGRGGPHVTLDDVIRHGPGLILDHRAVDGAQALVWADSAE